MDYNIGNLTYQCLARNECDKVEYIMLLESAMADVYDQPLEIDTLPDLNKLVIH